jgi:hypothetical protein
MMDSEEDVQISMRLAILDMISRRVSAVKRPGQSWHVTIDAAPVRFEECGGPPGDHALRARILEFASAAAEFSASGDLEDFNDAECGVCMCGLFQIRDDGGVAIDALEMKCPGGHSFHLHCAKGWIVTSKQTTCPYCRYGFISSVLFEDIAASLEHQVALNSAGTAYTVTWSRTLNQRLAALNVLPLLPRDMSLGNRIASALLLSCCDAAASVADAALRSGWLSSAIQGKTSAEILRVCVKIIEKIQALNTFGISGFVAMYDIMRVEDGRAGIVAAGGGGCAALVKLLKNAQDDYTRCCFSDALKKLAESEEGLAGVVAAGGCRALVEALKNTQDDNARCRIAGTLQKLARSEEGRAGVVIAGGCGALVKTLKNVYDEIAKCHILSALKKFAESEDGRAGVIAAGGCRALVKALRIAQKVHT